MPRKTKYFHWSFARPSNGDSNLIGRSRISPRYICGEVICSPPPPPVNPLNCSTISGNSVATASVTRARYRPLMRRAGRPMITPAMKHTTAEATVAPSSGMSRRVIRIPVVYAPTPYNAPCPTEICPL